MTDKDEPITLSVKSTQPSKVVKHPTLLAKLESCLEVLESGHRVTPPIMQEIVRTLRDVLEALSSQPQAFTMRVAETADVPRATGTTLGTSS